MSSLHVYASHNTYAAAQHPHHHHPSSATNSPLSPVFPHSHSLALNGQGTVLPSLRPGTSLGTAPAGANAPSNPPPQHGSSEVAMSAGTATSAGGGGAQGAQGGQQLDYASLPTWPDPTVSLWLRTVLPALPPSYADLFASNDIRGSVLLEVDQSALKEMGVRSVGDRVKICVAVRALRGKYLAAVGGGSPSLGGGGARNSVLGRVAAQGSRPSSPLVPSSATSSPVASPPHPNSSGFTPSPIAPAPLPLTHTNGTSGSGAGFSLGHSRPGSGSGSYSARSLSTGTRIPPPLHLAQSNVYHSQQHQQQQQMLGASPPSHATSPRSATFAPSTSSALHASRMVPPSGPPPNGRIPAAPSHPSVMGTNWLGDIPGLSQPPPATTISSSASGGSGLTASASTSSLAAMRSNTMPYGSSSTGGGGGASPGVTTSSSPSGHRKASSSSIATIRPSTAQPSLSSSPYAGHPYAAAASSSSASSGSGLLPSPMDAGKGPGAGEAGGYTVGRSTFARPSTAGGVVSTSGVIPSSSSSLSSTSSVAPAGSNLDLLRRAVKFTSADGVTSRVLAVGDAKDGREVLARVMKKFGGREGEDVDGWGVWTVEAGGGARLLTEHDLYQICQNASAPERTRGLIVRRHHTPSSSAAAALSTSPPAANAFTSQPSSPSATSSAFPSSSGAHSSPSKRGRKLQWVFGESHAPSAELTRAGGTVNSQQQQQQQQQQAQHSPSSPNYLGVEIPRMGTIEPASPGGSGSGDGDELEQAQKRAAAAAKTTKMNRASTVSVMSGLEAPDWARDYYAQGERFGGEGRERERAGERGAERGAERDFRVASPPQRTSSRRTPPSPYTPASPPQPTPASRVLPSSAAAAAPSSHRESTSSLHPATAATTRKLRNFFGQRPPSELITNHLTEYFPLGSSSGSPGGGGGGEKERHRLSKQVRASIRRSMSAAASAGGGAMGRRMSTASVASRASSTRANVGIGMGLGGVPGLPTIGGTSWEKEKGEKERGEKAGKGDGAAGAGGGESTAMSRFSGSSNGSAAELHITASGTSSPAASTQGTLPAPPQVASDAASIRSGRSPRSSSGSALDPPDEAEEEGEEDEGSPQSAGSASMVRGSSAASSSASNTTTTSAAAGTTPDGEGDGDADADADTRSIASSSLRAPSISGNSYLHPRRLSRRMSRMSGASSSRLSVGAQSLWERRSKDSDAASVVTMDEVTAELETRRASGVSWGAGGGEGYSEEGSDAEFDDEEEEDGVGSAGEEGFSDEEDEESEEYSDEEDEGEEPGTAKEQTRGIKWIKGALIGQGSFGSVFLGMNPFSGSLMAVKQVELPTGNSHNEERKKGMLDALEREIELLKVLQHENIVQYLDSSTDSQHLNIFLEYVPGGSVAALLQNYGAFEEALVSKFVRQILTGLDYLHERDIIHRDIKGANILVDNKGNIKISDFGISKKVEDNLLSGAKVHRPSLQGSVYWMAPEVVKQTAYTSKADIWSLGCLVVEMLTGAHPWANLTQMQAIFRIGSSIRPTVPDDISSDADDFLEQTFEIEHTDRPSARELLQHPFSRDPEAFAASQQTPTRATFSQQQQQSQQSAAVASP
ncbi:hypothetical protein JCM6882_004154 [Rhodosporidiobolus microsporus]